MKTALSLAIPQAASLAILQAASLAILQIYASSDFSVETKSDKSPLTRADRASHEIIFAALSKTGIPILSEEGRAWGHPSKGPRSRESTPLGQKIRFSRLGQNYLIIPRISLFSAFLEISAFRCQRIPLHQSPIRI